MTYHWLNQNQLLQKGGSKTRINDHKFSSKNFVFTNHSTMRLLVIQFSRTGFTFIILNHLIRTSDLWIVERSKATHQTICNKKKILNMSINLKSANKHFAGFVRTQDLWHILVVPVLQTNVKNVYIQSRYMSPHASLLKHFTSLAFAHLFLTLRGQTDERI